VPRQVAEKFTRGGRARADRRASLSAPRLSAVLRWRPEACRAALRGGPVL